MFTFHSFPSWNKLKSTSWQKAVSEQLTAMAID